MQYSVFVVLSLALAATARPRFLGSRAQFTLQNGQTALAQNQQFASLTASSPCTAGENACVNGEFAQCVNGKFVLQPCAGGLICAALPLVNSAGTSITCTTAADRDARIAATGATGVQRRDDGQGPTAEVRPGAKGAAGKAAPAKGAPAAPAKGAPAKGAPAAPAKGTPAAPAKGAPAKGTPAKAAPAKSTTAKAAPAKSATAKAAPPAASSSAAAAGAASATAAASSSAAATVAAASSAPAATATGSSNAASGGAAAGGNSDDPQKSFTLLKQLVAEGFTQDGQATVEAGQVPSLTSSNNFINFCATVPNLPITDGKQIIGGSCNPAPMGVIAAKTNMPAAKFVKPANLDTLPANTNFTVALALNHLETGHFVNAATNYFAAPQVVNAQGDIQGHSHIVIEKLASLKQTTPADPVNFAYFKGLNAPAENGVLSVVVPGLPAGVYRLASINSAANHQPALVAVAQHGSLDDMVYFTVQ